MTFNPEIHHRRSIRLKGYDYSQAGAYFVTICTNDKESIFGDVMDKEMRLNECGKITLNCWADLPKHYSQIELDEFIIMPNHVHGIVVFVGAPLAAPGIMAAPGIDVLPGASATKNKAQKKKGAASSAPTLGDVIRTFKSMSAIAVNRVLDRQGVPVWQRNYYEHIIRNENELYKTRAYVADNPLNWETDENFKT